MRYRIPTIKKILITRISNIKKANSNYLNLVRVYFSNNILIGKEAIVFKRKEQMESQQNLQVNVQRIVY